MSDETPKPWVTMAHPEAGSAVSSREGFDSVWAAKGWQVTAEHELNPNAEADADLEDALADNSSSVADETVTVPADGETAGDETVDEPAGRSRRRAEIEGA